MVVFIGFWQSAVSQTNHIICKYIYVFTCNYFGIILNCMTIPLQTKLCTSLTIKYNNYDTSWNWYHSLIDLCWTQSCNCFGVCFSIISKTIANIVVFRTPEWRSDRVLLRHWQCKRNFGTVKDGDIKNKYVRWYRCVSAFRVNKPKIIQNWKSNHSAYTCA